MNFILRIILTLSGVKAVNEESLWWCAYVLLPSVLRGATLFLSDQIYISLLSGLHARFPFCLLQKAYVAFPPVAII
jgi:hypothetical protein